MPQRRVTIQSTSGLHARPASLLTQQASASGFSITIGRPDQPPVDAASILSVMAMGVAQGEEVVLSCDDAAADDALDALATLLGSDLDAAGVA